MSATSTAQQSCKGDALLSLSILKMGKLRLPWFPPSENAADLSCIDQTQGQGWSDLQCLELPPTYTVCRAQLWRGTADAIHRCPCLETSGARCPSEIRIWHFIECYCVSQLYTIQHHPAPPCLQEDSGAVPRDSMHSDFCSKMYEYSY